jgi:2-polyprenyl-3-methyl-5-hydroxy-6-metoxy-1,4-benzoquinol methylase
VSEARRLPTEKEIVARYDVPALVEEERAYLRNHAPRFEYLLALVDRIRRNQGFDPSGRGLRVLDVGPSFQTQLLRDLYPEATVTTIGLEPSAVSTARPGERHIEFDLNDTLDPEAWPPVEPQQLVIMAEVIEHLYTPHTTVLRCGASWLEPDGALVLQTPNAASLTKRLRLLAGRRNPYELIRETRRNPGHFREYTLRELIAGATDVGLEPVESSRQNYVRDHGQAQGRSHFYRATRRVLPRSLRQGITICLRRPG